MSEAYPFVGASNAQIQAVEEERELPTFKEYAWDFDSNTFLYD